MIETAIIDIITNAATFGAFIGLLLAFFGRRN